MVRSLSVKGYVLKRDKTMSLVELIDRFISNFAVEKYKPSTKTKYLLIKVSICTSGECINARKAVSPRYRANYCVANTETLFVIPS